MKAFKITETGNFMTKLLSGRTFDSFLLEEASLSMQVTWILDGKINRNFYTKEEWEDKTDHPFPLISWSEVRGHMRELIRGKKAPASLSIVLQLRPDMMEQMLTAEGYPQLRTGSGTKRWEGSSLPARSVMKHSYKTQLYYSVMKKGVHSCDIALPRLISA